MGNLDAAIEELLCAAKISQAVTLKRSVVEDVHGGAIIAPTFCTLDGGTPGEMTSAGGITLITLYGGGNVFGINGDYSTHS